MDPDTVDQDAAEDVDMITAPASDTFDTSKSQESTKETETSSALPINNQETTKAEEFTSSMDISPPPGKMTPKSSYVI